MALRAALVVAIGFLYTLPGVVAAQHASADVTFEVPLNLTNLMGAITKVAVECSIESPALPGGAKTGRTEVAVVGGAVNQQVLVVVSVPQNELYKPQSAYYESANYQCSLFGFQATGVGWVDFTEATGGGVEVPFFQLSPRVDRKSGTFNW